MQGAAEGSPLLPTAAAVASSRRDEPRDTFWPCVANLSKVIIGAGMMAIPQAYYKIGTAAGASMLVLVGLMTYTTLVFLLRGSAATGATTYSQLTKQLCGTAVMKVLQVAVLSFCFGFGVVYLVIIRDILLGTPPACNGLLCELFGLPTSSSLYDARLVIILLALLVCCPLLLLRSMDRLAVLNVVGVLAIELLALTALGLAAKGLKQGSAYSVPVWPQWEQLGHTRAEQLQALTAVMPVMIACYVAHQSLHPLMPLLQPFSDAGMRSVIAVALLIAFAIFFLLAVASSIAFGPNLEVNVLNNFSVSGLEPLTGAVWARTLSWSIRGGYLLALLASLLLYMHPLRACLAEMIWPDTATQPGQTSPSYIEPRGTGSSVGLLHPEGVTTAGMNGTGSAAAGSSSVQQGWGGSSDSSKSMDGGRAGAAGGSSARPPQQQQQQQKVMGSAFATPAAQAGAAQAGAAAAAAGSSERASSGGGSEALSGSNSRPLTTFDSFDNPRTGSWSGVRYLSNLVMSPRQQQQQQVQKGSSGGGNASSIPAYGIGHTQQQQQQQQQVSFMHVRDGVHIHVSDAASLPPMQRRQGHQVALQSQGMHSQHVYNSSSSSNSSRWREQEQRWYYWLTYGLLAAMVLVTIAVPNIWAALSAIGDLASTLQAFVVPGLIGIILMRRTKLTEGSSTRMRLEHAASGGVGYFAVILGLALFVNGIYQRV